MFFKIGLQACNIIKKRLQHRCFPVNIAKFLRTAFSTEQLRWLLVEVRKVKTAQLNIPNKSRKFEPRGEKVAYEKFKKVSVRLTRKPKQIAIIFC